jgi:hypothetical protein
MAFVTLFVPSRSSMYVPPDDDERTGDQLPFDLEHDDPTERSTGLGRPPEPRLLARRRRQ